MLFCNFCKGINYIIFFYNREKTKDESRNASQTPARSSVFDSTTVWCEIFGGVHFCGLANFCVLQELILRLGQIGFSSFSLGFSC